MKYLKGSHNYMSMKMKYKLKQEQEFPALSKKNVEDDGFGHMVEEDTDDLEESTGEQLKKENEDASSKVDTQETAEPALKIDPTDFDYDETNNTIKPKNKKAFESLIEHHPTVDKLRRGDKRDKKVAGLKAKVLDTLKVAERRKRNLSCDSVRSDCSGWGDENFRERELSTDSSQGRVRKRSEDDFADLEPKKSNRQTKPILLPPKIILSQN